MKPLLVGIDVGTSSIKICMFELSGKLIKKEFSDVVLLTPCQGCVEIELNDLVIKVKGLLKRVISGFENQVEAIGFSVTNPTLVLMDKELNPIRPGIPYLDNRCQKEVELAVKSLGGPDNYFNRVGNRPSPSTCTAALINYLKKNEPEVWAKTYKAGFLNTFLAAQFTGKVAADPTTASYSGILNVREPYDWDDELIKISDIDKDILPEIKPSYHKVGGLSRSMAQNTGLREGIPVAIGSGDTAAASFALGLKQHGDMFESMGTSEVMTFCLDKPDLDQAFMNRSHVLPGLWLCHGAMSTAGAATSWLLNKVFPDIDDFSHLDEEADKSVPGSNGLIFVPYLSGERSPMFDSQACGLFFGLNLKTSRQDMIRSVFEGAGYGIRQICKIGEKRWSINPQSIKCVGGATKSMISMHIRSDILGYELAAIENDNAAAYGAALLGGMAAEIFTSIDEIPYLNTISRRVSPNPDNREIYEKYFEIYVNLYPQLKQSMHKLNEQ